MKLITVAEKIQLLKQICNALNKNKFAYLVYGSFAYQLITNDKNLLLGDIDIIIKHSDFSKLIRSLPDLSLNPIETLHTIHANSMQFKDQKGKPFDISFDSYEHYFAQNNIDLNNYKVIDLDGISVKLMKAKDLTNVYKIGLTGDNRSKIEEYRNKINNLESFSYDLK